MAHPELICRKCKEQAEDAGILESCYAYNRTLSGNSMCGQCNGYLVDGETYIATVEP